MKMKNMKRVLALLLAVIMVCVVFAGCNNAADDNADANNAGNNNQQNNAGNEASGDAWKEVAAKVAIPEIVKKDIEHLSWMDDTSPIDLEVYYATNWGSDVEFPAWGSTAVQQKITELTGVTVDGRFPTVSDAESNELTLLIASGDPLPGVITYLDKNSNQYKDLEEAGCLYDIIELAEQYAPELLENMDQYALTANMNEDGTMYYFPRQSMSDAASNYMVSNGWTIVRADICEDMGIDPMSIKTLADMEKYLQYVVDNKANYPELKYPVLMPTTTWASDPRPFYNAVGGILSYGGGLNMLYDEANDTVNYWIEDNYGKEAVKQMQAWAQKGYITEASFAAGNIVDEAMAGSVACGWGWNAWYAGTANATLEANGMDARYVQIPMVSAEGVDAVQSMDTYQAYAASGVTVITTDCPDPARAIRFLEFLNSEYGNLLCLAGIYGEDWVEEVDANGVMCVKPLNKEVAEGELPRGISNYATDWIAHSQNYEYVTSYSNTAFSADPIMATCAQDFVYNMKINAPNNMLNNVDQSSAEWQYYVSHDEIIAGKVADMILAKDDVTFEKLYKECLDELSKNHLAEWKELILGLTKEYIAAAEASGVEFN